MKLTRPVAVFSPAGTTSILKLWHITLSVLQSLFPINKLCDPSVHPNSLTNSNSNALNSVNYEYKLVVVSGL